MFLHSICEEDIYLSRFLSVPLHKAFISFLQSSPQGLQLQWPHTVRNGLILSFPPGLGKGIGPALHMGMTSNHGIRA